MVFLFAKNSTDFPTNLSVGDVLYLRNYVFEVREGKLSCKKPFGGIESEFRFFSGNPEETKYHPIDDNIGFDDADGTLLNCITNLRKFSKNHFKA
jgi:hypothetical protein